jgi:hypothetical protein
VIDFGVYLRAMRRLQLSATAAMAATALGLFAAPALAKTAPILHKHPTPRQAPTTPAVKASAQLYLYDAFFVDGRTIDVPGRTLQVTGYVSRYEPHQKVTLEMRMGTKVVKHRLNIRPGKSGHSGRFVGTVTAPHAGILHLRVVHKRSPRLRGFTAGRGVQIISESTTSKLFTGLVQGQLATLHFYMPQSDVWDLQTELAIEAYHRLLGRGTSSTLDPATLTDLLDGRGSFTVRYPNNGRHAEGDLSDQLIALVDGSKVQTIYPISSGKPSTPTILGNYRVYMRTPGYLPDGMYYSDFFIRGYAIHGYDPAPSYPASHGCMRLPISDAISAFDWLAIGDWVDVYGTPNESV